MTRKSVSENYVADALSRPLQVTSMYLRRYESKAEEKSQYESVDDDEEVIGQESLNRESIATL